VKQRNWKQLAKNLIEKEKVPVIKWEGVDSGLCYPSGIVCPNGDTPLAFAVIAHEVGHYKLQHCLSLKADWRVEMEAWNFSLKQMRKFMRQLPEDVAECIGSALYSSLVSIEDRKQWTRKLKAAVLVSLSSRTLPRITEKQLYQASILTNPETNIDRLLNYIV